MSILTFNTNGLGDKKKLKRLLKKVDPLVTRGGVVLLQETHVVNTDYLGSIWKNKFSSNCVSTNSAGVLILYNNDYELLEEYSDERGRQLIIAIKKEEEKYIVINAYYPNDHKTSLTFANELYEQILRIQQSYPEFETIYAGDLNTCLSSEDCLNRNRSKTEDILSDLIRENNKVINVTDTYRMSNPTDGFTWKRGSCYSRLDYVFMSKSLLPKIRKTKLDWAYEASDHAALQIDLKIEDIPIRGPGLIKVNTRILEDPILTNKIAEEIAEMMSQTDDGWDPHTKLEFLKVCIRSVISSKVMEDRRSTRMEIKECEEEINQIEELKINLLNKKKEKSEDPCNIEVVDAAAVKLKTKLSYLRNALSNAMNFASKAKWFEYGEKSNKFFLNLNRSRQQQKLISSIKCNDVLSSGQSNVTESIKNFYQNLYSKQVKEYEDDNESEDFYKFCPKLTEEDAKYMDEKLVLSDLKKALLTCKDSAPGSDGIPYLVYKKFWNISGQIILDAWNWTFASALWER
jgi:exonuclease III